MDRDSYLLTASNGDLDTYKYSRTTLRDQHEYPAAGSLKWQPRTGPMEAEDLSETWEESMEDGLRCLRCYEPARCVNDQGLCRECVEDWPGSNPTPSPPDAEENE
jgi:hypothetical protein